MFKKNILAVSLMILSSASQAAVIALANGDTLSAEVVKRTVEHVVVSHAVLGEVSLANAQVLHIDGVELAALPAPEPAPVVVAEVKPGLFNSGILRGWNRSVAAGFNGAKGNTDTMAMYAGLKANYEDDTKRWKFDSSFDSSENAGTKTQNKFYAGLTRDWLIEDSKWFYFASAKYDWDEFKDWDYRVTGLFGGGYQFMKTDTRSLLGRFGLAGKQNFGGTADDDFKPEAMLGLDADWILSDKQSLHFTTEFFAGLESVSEYRNLTKFAWKILIDETWDMNLQLGFDNEHESTVAPGIDKNDFRYRAALVWDL